MGYRSQVVLAIAPEAASAFMAVLAKHPQSMALCNDADKFESGYEREGDWLVHWSYIKWYEGYAGVDAVNEFMQWCHETDIKDENFPEDRQPSGDEFFRFVRVGEDQDDIVQDGYCEDFQIYTHTSIEVY